MVQVEIDERFINQLKDKLIKDKVSKTVVGAAIFKQDKILLLRRASGEFMEGLVELPSGTVDPKEGILDALVREVKEETDLEVISIRNYIDCFDYVTGYGKKTRQFNFIIEVVGDVKVNLKEHDRYYWVSPSSSDFEQLYVSKNTRDIIHQAEHLRLS